MFGKFEAGLSLGRITIGGVGVDRNHGFGTLGYRSCETILPIDGPVYVLGVVTSDGGIGRPNKAARGAGFIISHRSEEVLAGSYQGDRLFMWVGYGAVALGALIVVIAIVVGLLFV